MNNLNAVERCNGENLEGQDHGFRVGDFVWRRGRFPTDHWWPGQVFDPSDASEFALLHRQEGRLLVVLFGDGSCSWCLPSDLLPFFHNLDKLRSADSKVFLNAVQKTVDEIGRIVESKIICRCTPLERRGHLARPVVVNVGVKAGVLAPDVDIARLSIPDYDAYEILDKVNGFAKFVSFDSVFELAILRSWISAYSYARCGSHLCVYCDPIPIEGLEDRDGDNKIVAFHGPEVDGSSSPKASSAMSEDKVYLRRKKKHIADLMVMKKGETESTYRERKKSKYLSPPFTELSGRTGNKLPASQQQDLSAFSFDSGMDDEATSEEWLDTTGPKNSLAAAQYGKQLTFGASDVDLDVQGVLLMLQSAALNNFYLRDEGQLDPVCAFVLAYKSSMHLHGPDYKVFQKCKKASKKRKSIASPYGLRPHECSPKNPSPRKRSAGKRASSQATDDLVSHARAMRQKLDTMTKLLEKHGSSLSVDDKSCLKDDMKRLMEEIETVSEKVRPMAQNNSSSSS